MNCRRRRGGGKMLMMPSWAYSPVSPGGMSTAAFFVCKPCGLAFCGKNAVFRSGLPVRRRAAARFALKPDGGKMSMRDSHLYAGICALGRILWAGFCAFTAWVLGEETLLDQLNPSRYATVAEYARIAGHEPLSYGASLAVGWFFVAWMLLGLLLCLLPFSSRRKSVIAHVLLTFVLLLGLQFLIE